MLDPRYELTDDSLPAGITLNDVKAELLALCAVRESVSLDESGAASTSSSQDGMDKSPIKGPVAWEEDKIKIRVETSY